MNIVGRVFEASFEKGVLAELDREEDVEEYSIGSMAIIDSEKNMYLGIINEVKYESGISSFILFDLPRTFREPILDSIRKKYIEYIIKLIPVAKYYKDSGVLERPDTIPGYGSRLLKASSSDISLFYGESDWRRIFPLGRPKLIGETGYEVPVDIKNLVNLNFGIYGKSGSGKTFAANLLVGYGVLYTLYAENSVNLRFLIFDMHDEYSLSVLDNNRIPIAKGVANIFSDEFRIYTPDIENSRRYKMIYLPIPLYDISSSLLSLLIEPLGVSPAFLENLKSFENIIRRVLIRNRGSSILNDPNYWVLGLILSDESLDRILYFLDNRDSEFIDIDPSVTRRSLRSMKDMIEERISEESKGALESFKAGRRRLTRLLDMPISLKKRYAFAIDEIIDNILDPTGKNIVISMGKYEKTTPVYLALANLVGDALRRRLQEKIYEGIEELPTKVIIMLEEAHKFLSKTAGVYSPFGIIAREMRKRGVIVVPIDQKPSELDPDVSSMIWTSIVFALTDDKDVSAALSGVENPKLYEPLIYSLKPGEALIYGPAVKFPVVLRIKDYSRVSKEFMDIYRKMKGVRGERSLYEDDLSRE